MCRPAFPSSTGTSCLRSLPYLRGLSPSEPLFPPIMYSSRKHLQARFAPSLRNRFRASKPPPPAPTTTSDQPSHLIGRSFSNAWFHNPPAHERLSFCEDDLLDLDPEDIPEASTFHPYPEYPSQSQSPLSSSTCHLIFRRVVHLNPAICRIFGLVFDPFPLIVNTNQKSLAFQKIELTTRRFTTGTLI